MSLLCTCSSCKHFRLVREEEAGGGECRRFPPTLHFLPSMVSTRAGAVMVQSHYARMRTDWTCGEWGGVSQ